MIIVLSVMVAGIILGALLNDKKKLISIIDKFTNWAIYALLFLLGISVGLNKTIINHLDSIGVKALIITIGAVLGSITTALIVYKIFFKKSKIK
ncbi:MAG: LysO family transporter [Bacteroidetes bacterium]|nr:LysO family transporter [Bacteroidota bacterium]